MSQSVLIQNTSQPTDHPIQAKYCSSFWCKFRGLMLRPSLEDHEGLLLVEKSDSRINASIHMLFMRMDLCVVWINSRSEVVDVALARRWQPMLAPKGPASLILETHPDRLSDFHPGDRVEITAHND